MSGNDSLDTGTTLIVLGIMRLVVALFGLLVAVLGAEVLARVTGNTPWTKVQTAGLEPVCQDPDPELGWWLRPGGWRYGPYVRGGKPVDVMIGDDRTRRTRDRMDGAAGPEVLLLGCSFTFGWAVSDDETWAWGLQAIRPDLDVRNRGTPGYSAFQALLLLERVLASGERPARVIFGYISEATPRNAAEPHWVKALNAFSRGGPVAVPYGTIDREHRLVRHPARAYPTWPFHRWSAAVTLLEWRWLELSARSRVAQTDEVTRLVFAEMAHLCQARGIPFSVVVLHVLVAQRAPPFPRDVDVITCDHALGRGDVVRGESHPNARTHAAWATCVADALARRE